MVDLDSCCLPLGPMAAHTVFSMCVEVFTTQARAVMRVAVAYLVTFSRLFVVVLIASARGLKSRN